MKYIKTENLKPFKIENAEICIYPSIDYLKGDFFEVKQFHSNLIIDINKDINNEIFNGDGLTTSLLDKELIIKTSDCAPICIISDTKIGIFHVGWRGLVSGMLKNALSKFENKDISIYIAPFLHNFEIKRDFCFLDIKNVFGQSFFDISSDKILFNFKEAIIFSLKDYKDNIIFDERNTKDDISLPSNRGGQKYNFITSIKIKNDDNK